VSSRQWQRPRCCWLDARALHRLRRPHPGGAWRVVPLTSTSARPDRIAMLINEQAGDTWIYDIGSNDWTPVERK
jgi:hypothetical protein